MKAKIRDRQVIVRVNSDESLLILRASVMAGLHLSTWIRAQAIAAARRMLQENKEESNDRV